MGSPETSCGPSCCRSCRLRLVGCSDVNNVSPPPAGPGPLTIVTTSLPDATVGQPYAAVVGGSGGITPYTWSLAASSPAMPAGLSLDTASGAITGIPTVDGTTSLVFRLEDESDPDSVRRNNPADHDRHHAPAAGNFHFVAPGRGCEPAVPSHNLAGNGWNPTLFVVGTPPVAERITVQCSIAGHDQRHSPERNGGHDDTYVYGG